MNKNVTAFIMIIVAIGIYFTVTSGMIADAKAVKAVNDQYSSALDDAARLVQVRDAVVKQYNSISPEDRDHLDKMIPSTVDTIRLIIDMNNIAVQHGFTLPDIKALAPSGSSKPSGSVNARPGQPLSAAAFATPVLDTITVGFSVKTSYDQFISFLQDLESNLRVMDITQLSVTNGDNGQYMFSVKLNTYWLRQ